MNRFRHGVIIRLMLPVILLIAGYYIIKIDYNKYFYSGNKDLDSPIPGFTPQDEAKRLAQNKEIEQKILNNKLKEACEKGDLAQVARLLDEGATINFKPFHEERNAIPIILASANGHLEIVKYLILKGADIDARGNNGITALMAAIGSSHFDIAKFLLDHGADATAVDNDSETTLHKFRGERSVELIILLIKKGADPNAPDFFMNRTPLHLAASDNQVQAIDTLLSYGSTIESRDKNGCTPLHYAAEGNAVASVDMLIDRGAVLDAKDEEGATPLHYAAYRGNVEAMMRLIARGAGINLRTIKNSSPLHYSAERGTTKAVELLIMKGANLDIKNSASATPLHIAAHYGYTDIVKLLVAKGAQINSKENHGYTVLDVAEMSPSPKKEIINLLIKNGAIHGRKHHAGPSVMTRFSPLEETGWDRVKCG